MDETIDMLMEIIKTLSKKVVEIKEEKDSMRHLLGQVVTERDKLRKENEAYIKLVQREADMHDA